MTIPTTMKAWRLPAYNQDVTAAIDGMVLDDVPLHGNDLAANEILVKVHYASVNPIDWKLFSGGMQGMFPIELPYTPGFDVAGEVVATGNGVSNKWTIGDRVIADVGLVESVKNPSPTKTGPAGAFAQYIVLPAELVVKVPAAITDLTQVAGLPLAGLTSYQALVTGQHDKQLGQTKAGDKVLILGGAGGTGTLAIQMAKALGCSTVATTASTAPYKDGKTKLDFCKELGADVVIDYKTQDWAEVLVGQDYDLIFDTTGVPEDLTERAPKVLKKGGAFVSIANYSGQSTDDVRFANYLVKSNGTDLQVLVDWIVQGSLQVPIEKVYDFADVKEALKDNKAGRSAGKILIKVNH